MTIEIISRSISTKVWDRAGIELATPEFAVNLASVARHVTNCPMWPGTYRERYRGWGGGMAGGGIKATYQECAEEWRSDPGGQE